MNTKFLIISTLLLFYSCSNPNKNSSTESFWNIQSKISTKKIAYPNQEFEIQIPKDWEWKVENYEEIDQMILGIDVVSQPDKNGYIDIMSIRKEKSYSNQNELQKEAEAIIDSAKKNSICKSTTFKAVRIGGKEAFSIFCETTYENPGAPQILEIILQSKANNEFYHLIASASKSENYEKNMSDMIKCLKTFKEM